MELLDNVNKRIGDALKNDLCDGATLCVIAENFSLSAYEQLRECLKKIRELRFIFSKPTLLKAEEISEKTLVSAREFKERTLGKN